MKSLVLTLFLYVLWTRKVINYGVYVLPHKWKINRAVVQCVYMIGMSLGYNVCISLVCDWGIVAKVCMSITLVYS